MAAPVGNSFWKARSSSGPKPKFDNADDLWNACCEYFEWVESNPLMASKIAQNNGMPIVVEYPKMRAMTVLGLCVFLDIGDRTWRTWREEREDLKPIIERVDRIIDTQKIEGAAADLLNANIVARLMGLSDRKDHTSSDGSMTPQVITRTIVDPKAHDAT